MPKVFFVKKVKKSILLNHFYGGVYQPHTLSLSLLEIVTLKYTAPPRCGDGSGIGGSATTPRQSVSSV